MDSHALTARDVSNDFFPTNRIAALGSVNKKVIESLDLELGVLSQPQYTFDDRRYLRFLNCRLFLQAIRRESCEKLLCGYFAVSNRREQIFDLGGAVVR